MAVFARSSASILLFFLVFMVALELGRRMRLREVARGAADDSARFAVLDGAIFGLMGLIMGFTFAGAMSRYDTRRDQIVEEANDIGTAYLRLDLLPEGPRTKLQATFRTYLDARLEGFRAMPDTVATLRAFARADSAQRAIWTEAVAATQADPNPTPALLLLPALNQMFDVTSTRTASMRAQLPGVIMGLLMVLLCGCALLAGYGVSDAGTRHWGRVAGFALVLAITLYVILDLEHPRIGLINLRSYDRPLLELRASMGE